MSCNTIQIYREDSKVINFTLTDKKTGEPFNLSNYEAVFAIKANRCDKDANAIFIQTFSDLGSDGIISVSLNANNTTIDTGQYFYALKIYNAGVASTIIQSKLTIVPFWDGE